ncbi:hypothetical protein G0Q06_04600 [Puniceicoccales bacterium CK1056]|uniref:Uncharacterized protein n=1 Tax=Oceanipulchritudo coccoides TaxID=2706888 RepID=A0A6B2LZZ1_9BACT|nr:hypothetical protein [Oceanipulchritudo coccoides]NDV61722.1 hypothetical protein [Oceanipulchritudo coccoides]
MKEPLIIDMVHHNPGEKPFETAYTDPFHLKSLGFNGQCLKHINTIIRFDGLKGAIAPSEEEIEWLDKMTAQISKEIEKAKEAGLRVYYHIDLFILPKRIIDSFHEELIDPKTGKISVSSPKVLDLHQHLFEEMFERFPGVDGLIVRVGENYLFDTPFHAGNSAVTYEGETYSEQEIDGFVTLIRFLREHVCEKHNRMLIYRTWDIQNNRFHSNPEFYLKVTDRISPHENLIFSIKHTHIDFHRYARWNPCLGIGKHPQIVEVQCQREYEGKGAYPNFSSAGVIDGFPEVDQKPCLRSFVQDEHFAGVYNWSRGGGWYGPYVDKSNEFWVDLNVRYITSFLKNSHKNESSLFEEVTRDGLNLQIGDQHILYRLSTLSLDAVLKGKFCAVWDTRPGSEFDKFPTNQWMRDDVLGGWDLLEPIFAYLYEHNLGETAIQEKMRSVTTWKQIVDISCDLDLTHDNNMKKVIQSSCQYGLRLFSYIAHAWQALYLDYSLRQGSQIPLKQLENCLRETNLKWNDYCQLSADYPCCATLYRSHGWHWPGSTPPPGLGEAISDIYNKICRTMVK